MSQYECVRMSADVPVSGAGVEVTPSQTANTRIGDIDIREFFQHLGEAY
jgi:hypothetical protein